MDLTDAATRAGATLSRAQEQVKDLGLAAGEQLDAARKGTAEGLEKAAGKLDSTARYIRSNDVGGMLGNTQHNMQHNLQRNLRQVIGRNPTGFLILAAGIGFLAGAAFARNNSREQA
jgi:hypothetical protein